MSVGTVVESVEASLKALVAEKSYRSITVKAICEGAFISRRTFYANFIDKRAVVAYIFRRDAVEPVLRVLELLDPSELKEMAPIVLTRFYQGIYDERDFYFNLVRPMAGNDPTFELVAARAIYGALGKLMEKYGIDLGDSGPKVLYYHAAGWSIFLEKWIYDGCADSPEAMGEIQADVLVPSLAHLGGGAAQ